jgi:hypothetical protein
MRPETKNALDSNGRTKASNNIAEGAVTGNDNTMVRPTVHPFRKWIAERIYPGNFFNSDASLEIDRLTAEIEQCEEERHGN